MPLDALGCPPADEEERSAQEDRRGGDQHQQGVLDHVEEEGAIGEGVDEAEQSEQAQGDSQGKAASSPARQQNSTLPAVAEPTPGVEPGSQEEEERTRIEIDVEPEGTRLFRTRAAVRPRLLYPEGEVQHDAAGIRRRILRKKPRACCHPGNFRLSHRLIGSTIGAGRLHFCVRNGNRCGPSAIVTGMTAHTRCSISDALQLSAEVRGGFRKPR